MYKLTVGVWLVFLFFGGKVFSQSVSAVQVSQEGKNIIVEYTLQTKSSEEIRLYFSRDGGKKYIGPLNKVYGDVGRGVRSGRKRIEWRALEEYSEFVGDNIVFMVEIYEAPKMEVNSYSAPTQKSSSQSDFDGYMAEGGQVRLSGLFEGISSEEGSASGWGLRLEWFLASSFSIDWQFLFGENKQENFYTQVPGAMMLFSDLSGDPWLGPEQDEDVFLLWFFGMFIPESFTLHFYPHPKLSISSSVAFLRSDYNQRNNQLSSLGGALTMKAHYQPVSRLTLSPALGLHINYGTGSPSVIYGLGLGVRL
jgi:hypothetical protein